MKVKLLNDDGYDEQGIVDHVYEAILRPWGITILGSLLLEHSYNTNWVGIAEYAFTVKAYEVVEDNNAKVCKKLKRQKHT